MLGFVTRSIRTGSPFLGAVCQFQDVLRVFITRSQLVGVALMTVFVILIVRVVRVVVLAAILSRLYSMFFLIVLFVQTHVMI